MFSRLLTAFVLLFTTSACIPIAAGYISYKASNAYTDRKLAISDARNSERTLRAASLLSTKSYIHRGDCLTARTAVETLCNDNGRTTDIFRSARDTRDGQPRCLVEYSCKIDRQDASDDNELPAGDNDSVSDDPQALIPVRSQRTPFRSN